MIRSFVYRAFVSCIVRSFVCAFRIVRSFVCRAFALCIVRSFRVSCVFRIVRVKRSFVFCSLAFGAYCKLIRSRICM
jgi:hypothetical protein